MKELFLSQNQLDGSIPTWLGRLTSLQQLYLSQNQLTGSIPTELENLTDLQRLYLNNNMLTGAIPTELETLTQLREFYLGDNQLTGTIPTWLGDLANLEYLNLSNNSLNGTIPTELGNLTSLQSLFLQDNGLSEEIPTELGNLTNLELLGLWGNEELTWDTISNELGKSADRAVLGYLYGVNGGEDWSNNDNWFSSEEDQTEISSSWYGVGVNSDGRVSELNLAKNNLKEKLTNALEALDSLETLNLSDNPELTGTLPERLMNLLFLETLDIRCTGVSTPADTDFKMWLSRISFQEGPCPPPPSPPSSSPPSPPPSPPPSLNPSESPEGTVSITDNEEVALSPKNEGGSIDLGNGKTIELTVTRDEDLPPSSGNPSIILSPDLLDRIDEITFELSADSPEAAPSGFRLGGFVADIDLGVELEKGETVTVCLPAPEGDGESALYHYDERQGMWIRLASRVETISGERLVCAETDALSLFGVFVAEQSRPPVNPPTTGGGTQGGGGCAIASNGVKGNMFSSVLLNLLLMLSVPFLVASRKRR